MKRLATALGAAILTFQTTPVWAQEKPVPEEPVPDCGPSTLVPCWMLPALDWWFWDVLASCESNGNWAISDGMYEGGIQFHPQTWDRYKVGVADEDAAYQAPREVQIEVGRRVLAREGLKAWPGCTRRLGFR